MDRLALGKHLKSFVADQFSKCQSMCQFFVENKIQGKATRLHNKDVLGPRYALSYMITVYFLFFVEAVQTD